MIDIQNLTAGYPGRSVLENLNIRFPEGKVTAVLGPNGCGKTTLLKALCGILPAKGGVILKGKDLLSLPPRAMAQKIAYLSQSRPVSDLTAGYLVLCGRYPHGGCRYSSEDEEAARAAMEAVGIQELADCPLTKLSGGQRQKVYIAMALAQDTPVILLDEPTTFLDVAHQLQLLRQLRELAQQGKTVIAVLHDLQSALQFADHILLMDEGKAVTQGTPEEVFASGWLNRVFQVTVDRVMADGRWHYFCK